MSPFSHVEELFERTLGLPPAATARILATVLVITAFLLMRRLARMVIARTTTDPSTRYQINKVVAYVAGTLAVILLFRVWSEGTTGLATYLGLASAGVAIALQDPLTNLAGWFFIVIRRPFGVGDRIQIGAHIGDVVDIRLFRCVLLEIGNWVHADQSTGRVLHVPNGWVFKNSIATYDAAFGYIWNELEVTVTFESDWRRAKDVLTRTVTDHAEKLSTDAEKQIAEAAEHYHIKFSKLTPVVWTSVVDSGIRLTMRYLCKPRERRSSASEIWESVLDALNDLPDVDLAYPTTRFFDQAREGKSPSPSASSGTGAAG